MLQPRKRAKHTNEKGAGSASVSSVPSSDLFGPFTCSSPHPARWGKRSDFRVAGTLAEIGLLHKVGSTYEMETRLNRESPYIRLGIFDGRPDHLSTEGIQLINPSISELILGISR